MTAVRIEKSFTRVLNALAELEALTVHDAPQGVTGWLARLEHRLERHLLLCARVRGADDLHDEAVVLGRLRHLKSAVARNDTPTVVADASALRDELAAHEAHALQRVEPEKPAPERSP